MADRQHLPGCDGNGAGCWVALHHPERVEQYRQAAIENMQKQAPSEATTEYVCWSCTTYTGETLPCRCKYRDQDATWGREAAVWGDETREWAEGAFEAGKEAWDASVGEPVTRAEARQVAIDASQKREDARRDLAIREGQESERWNDDEPEESMPADPCGEVGG